MGNDKKTMDSLPPMLAGFIGVLAGASFTAIVMLLGPFGDLREPYSRANSKQVGRYQTVRLTDHAVGVLDTRTGELWWHGPTNFADRIQEQTSRHQWAPSFDSQSPSQSSKQKTSSANGGQRFNRFFEHAREEIREENQEQSHRPEAE